MERNAFKSKSVSQVRMYIMMGLGLIFPIILYCAFEISWKNVFMCRENSIADIVVIALIVEIIKLILYIVDIVKVAAATDKVAMLIVLFFFCQPAYFVYRQTILKQSVPGSIVYLIVGILEPVLLIIGFVFGVFYDVGNALQGLGMIG